MSGEEISQINAQNIFTIFKALLIYPGSFFICACPISFDTVSVNPVFLVLKNATKANLQTENKIYLTIR